MNSNKSLSVRFLIILMTAVIFLCAAMLSSCSFSKDKDDTAEQTNITAEDISSAEEAEADEEADSEQEEPSEADNDDEKAAPQEAQQEKNETPNTEAQNKDKPDDAAGETVLKCTVSVSCATILDNMDMLDPDKKELVPADGWILKPVEVTFSEGDSVYDVLSKVLREKKIHMESTKTPAYDSVYIEGIGNLYEFDCGSLSGWTYCVNGSFPNFGCSSYILKSGDRIEFRYTCDLGRDVGDEYFDGAVDQDQ